MAVTPNPISFSQSLATFLASYGVELDNEKEESTLDPTPWDWANLIDCYVQAQWEHNRGDANTIKGVAGGSRTAVADIPLAANQFLVNRGGTLQGDTLDVADLPSHSHTFDDTVHGDRGGDTLHAVASGAAAGFMSAADKTKLDGIAGGTIEDIGDTTLYQVDYASLASAAIANGANTIDGIAYTGANAAAATLLEVLAGSGIHFDASASNTGFSTSGQSAPYFTTTLGALLGSNFDPFASYVLWWRIGSATLNANQNTVRFFVTGPASFTDMGHIALGRPAGTRGFTYGGAGAGGTAHTNSNADVVALVIQHNLVRGYVGTWASGWPAKSSLTYIGANTAGIGANADESGHCISGLRVGVAFATGETGAAMDVIIRQSRLQRIRG